VSQRRTAILIGAIAVGVVAVLLIWQYVRNIQNSVDADNALVSVFVATDTIPRGTDGGQAVDAKQIQAAQIPQKYAPATHIQSTDAVQKKVALFEIAPGTVIVDGMFVDPATSQISFRERLKNKDHVALSLAISGPNAVGGFLVPGDEVNIMVSQDNSGLKQTVTDLNTGQPPKGGDKIESEMDSHSDKVTPKSWVIDGGPQWILMNSTARYLYQKVQILAVGSTPLLTPGEQASSTSTSNGSTPPADNGSITFNVPPVAAQYLVSFGGQGMYLTLVPKDYTPTPLPPLAPIQLQLPGEDPTRLCPYYAPQDGSCTAAG
jgi:Flp pilus assembly protein CpaB